MKEIIEKIRDEFNRIEDGRQEGNVKYHIIQQLFLKCCGYSMGSLDLEKPTVRGFIDIYVPTNGNEALAVEVKNGKEPLQTRDILQALKYAKQIQQRFALLTNGKEYVLLDFDMESDSQKGNTKESLESYVVFWFNVFKPKGKGLTELKYFKYLSYENLYKNKSTHFFCDIARYREWKFAKGIKENSWTAYRCTLFQFYDFYAQYRKYIYEYESKGKQCYETLGPEDFHEFIRKCKRHKEKSSTRTIESNFSHVYDMLRELKRQGRIANIILSESRTKNLFAYEQTKRKKTFVEITVEDIKTVLDSYKKRKNANRNIVAFLLTITLGLERSQLIDLRWDAFDKKLRCIIIDGRRIEICELLKKYLLYLSEESNKKKTKSPYVLLTCSNGKYNKMSEWGINYIFDELVKITNDEKWGDYSPKYLRNCLILSLFKAKYSLEDIIYITGIDIKNICNYITTDMILERKNSKVNWKKIYDGILCDTSL